MNELNKVQRKLKHQIGSAKFTKLFYEAAKIHAEKGRKEKMNHCLDVVVLSELEDMEERAWVHVIGAER